MIRTYRDEDRPAVYGLWNTVGAAMGYAPLTPEEVDRLLLFHPDFRPEYTFVLEEHAQVLGFVNGCADAHIPKGEERGYVTCLLLSNQADNPDNTRKLLSALEGAFRAADLRYSAVSCFNPIHLPWVIPGTPGHQHNNAPGIAAELPLNGRMRTLGYREVSVECAMHRLLEDFSMPQWVLEKAAKMEKTGYTVAQYDPRRHAGLEELVRALDNPMWSAEIPEAGRTGLRLLVGLRGNTCAGFTGPIYPESTGRGYFAGIAVAAEFTRRGLGTLLFYRLLQAEQEAGARYMSLFTGESNPARQIYLEAGLQVVRRFSVMLKEL